MSQQDAQSLRHSSKEPYPYPKFPNELEAQKKSDYEQQVNELLNQPAPYVQTGELVKGESKIEYIPYDRVVTEYEEVKRYVQVPTKKQFIDYRPVQYDVEYVPIKTYEKQVDYVPVERYVEKTEYQVSMKPTQQQQQQQISRSPPIVQQQFIPQQNFRSSFVQPSNTSISQQFIRPTILPPQFTQQQFPQPQPMPTNTQQKIGIDLHQQFKPQQQNMNQRLLSPQNQQQLLLPQQNQQQVQGAPRFAPGFPQFSYMPPNNNNNINKKPQQR